MRSGIAINISRDLPTQVDSETEFGDYSGALLAKLRKCVMEPMQRAATLTVKVIGGSMTEGSMNDCFRHQSAGCRAKVPWPTRLGDLLQASLPGCKVRVTPVTIPGATIVVFLSRFATSISRSDDMVIMDLCVDWN